jgi:hypothetical protein
MATCTVHRRPARLSRAARSCVIQVRIHFHFIQSFMQLFQSLTRPSVVRHGHSDCAHYVIVDVLNASCIVSFVSGNVYSYENVSRRALVKLLLQDNISLGRWINDALLCVDNDKVVCKFEPQLNVVRENVPYLVAA